MTAKTGFSRRAVPRRGSRLYGPILLALCLSAPVEAQNPPIQHRRIAIPATTLRDALTLLGRQTGADIISTEPGLATIRVRRVAGDLSPRAALDRLLAGSGYRAVAIDARSFRVVRDAAARPKSPAAPVTTIASADVIVTASKQRVPLLRYPGTLSIVDPAVLRGAAAPRDLSGVARVAPVLQNTEFGPGRNKIFIRGVADSSFAGAAQSTASVYFGDVQLGYSGADPGIRLYDMASVEVMEGPQGTLYGTGSIGGVIRLTPNAVDLTRIGGSFASGVTLTRHGAAGSDLGGTLNLPIVAGTAGLRATAYRVRDGGYIDDPARGASDVNRADTLGGRVALRVAPGGGWHVDLSGLGQTIDVADAQYAEHAIGALARTSALAQPYRSDVALGRLVVTKDWANGLSLLSATGIANAHADDLFDATPRRAAGSSVAPSILVYRTQGSKLLLSHEMRLARSLANGSSWVAGGSLLRARDTQNRLAGPPRNPTEIIGVTNVTRSASLFAEGTVTLLHDFAATAGVRATLARTDGEPSVTPRSADFVRGRSTRRLDPTLAFSWRLAPALAMFGRLQSGYRTGGLAVARGIGRVADFRSDSIVVGEVGIRKLRQHETGLALTAALSRTRWRDIQADLVNRRGLPYTDNIGNARIAAVEGTADWVPVRGLRATAAFLYTSNAVTGPVASSSVSANRRLPETPPFAGTAGVSYEWAVGAESTLSIGGTAAYVGRSVLGTGDLLDISQGRYATLGLSGGWRWRDIVTSLTLDNLTNVRGNRFASGNPLTFTARDQTTPLRPLNARLGVALTF